MKTVLVIRFSSQGDVALLMPVLQTATEKNPEYKFLFLTKKASLPLSSFIPSIDAIPLLNRDFFSLLRLFFHIKKKFQPDIILDMHDSLRSKILCFLFFCMGKKICSIEKGRSEKKQLTRRRRKSLIMLKHTTIRYREVFIKAHLRLPLDEIEGVREKYVTLKTPFIKKRKSMGIAPIAKYNEKTYPLTMMGEVIKLLEKKDIDIYLFGSPTQKQQLSFLEIGKNVFNIAGRYSLRKELTIMYQLQLMLSMDSANAHLAAWMGTPVMTLWGATHPFLGFAPFHQKYPYFIVQNENIHCRPCSVFGNRKCFQKELYCLNTLSPQRVAEKINIFMDTF